MRARDFCTKTGAPNSKKCQDRICEPSRCRRTGTSSTSLGTEAVNGYFDENQFLREAHALLGTTSLMSSHFCKEWQGLAVDPHLLLLVPLQGPVLRLRLLQEDEHSRRETFSETPVHHCQKPPISSLLRTLLVHTKTWISRTFVTTTRTSLAVLVLLRVERLKQDVTSSGYNITNSPTSSWIWPRRTAFSRVLRRHQVLLLLPLECTTRKPPSALLQRQSVTLQSNLLSYPLYRKQQHALFSQT